MQAMSLIFSILTSSFIIFTQTFAQLPYEANESGNGNVRNPLNVHDVPFVPEEFRSSQKRIIFDKNDFVSLLPSSDSKPLKEAILNLLVSIQSNANDTKIYNDIALTYAGLAKLGGRPGHSAHFAATVKLQICQENMTACHFEECDLDLDQKDEADPHNYKPVFTLHSKECTRLDSWCYFCQAYDELDRPVLNGGVGCADLEDLPEKRNCNAEHGDLSVQEQWGCKTTYAIVAGQSEVIDKDCIAVPQDKVNAETECTSLDDSDYEVQCICHGGSGCNLHDDPDLVDSIVTAPNDAILSEVNKSIRQLRADLKRVIRRYAKAQQVEE